MVDVVDNSVICGVVVHILVPLFSLARVTNGKESVDSAFLQLVAVMSVLGL